MAKNDPMTSLPRVADADRHAWIEPGPQLVAPGIHRIPLPLPQDGLRAVNVYAIETGDRLTLVDGGWAIPEASGLLAASLDRIGHAVGHIERVLVTHSHRDHYTNAVALRRQGGAQVALGEHERDTLRYVRDSITRPGHEPGDELGHLRRAGAGTLADVIARVGTPSLTPQDWEDPDEWLADRQRIELLGRELEAIHTPGHTRGHLVFADAAAQVLFAGDHVLPHITPSIGFEPRRAASPLRDYLASLTLVREMPDAVLLPAHGPATASVHERVDELLAHHAERLDLTLAALEGGEHTAYEVARRLHWTRRRLLVDDMDLFNAILAILETVAHLEVLRERGVVRGVDLDGVEHYLPA